MPRQALLVTFDAECDPELARLALEDLLRRGALHWIGMNDDGVQVWKTADLTKELDPSRRSK